MKKTVLFSILLLATFPAFTQEPNDFFVTLLTNSTADSVLVQVSVPLNENLDGETMEITIGHQRDTLSHQIFQVSARLPLSEEDNLQTYQYGIPFRPETGVTYHITLNNPKLCNVGTFRMEHSFEAGSACTYSYALPGYKQVQATARKESN